MPQETSSRMWPGDEAAKCESYWASFMEKSFSRGQRFKVYSGILNGSGPKCGDKCVVKVFKQCPGNQELCSYEVKKSFTFKQQAKAFNTMHGDRNNVIRVTTLYWALMDEVSKLKMLLFSGHRKLKSMEAVLFEDDLRVGELSGKRRKVKLYMDNMGSQGHTRVKLLEAFSHFTYHNSGGQYVVCGLEGVQESDGFMLKTPTIHSVSREYGEDDQGELGIQTVFQHHVCNDLCKRWIKPSVDPREGDDCAVYVTTAKTDIRRGSSSSVGLQDSPTAPTDIYISDRVSTRSSTPTTRPGPSVLERAPSKWSQATDNMSAYLEPTAPTRDECSEAEFLPPPYSAETERRVARWIGEDVAENYFMSTSRLHENVFPLQPLDDENGNNANEFVIANQVQKHANTCDENANASCELDERESNIDNFSTTGFIDDDEGDQDCEDTKQVRFHTDTDSSLPKAAPSVSAMSSETPSTSRVSETMDMSTNPRSSVSSSPITPRSIMRRGSLQRPNINLYRGNCLENFFPGYSTPILNIGSPSSPPDKPPSYEASQTMTAIWVLRPCDLRMERYSPSGGLPVDNGNIGLPYADSVFSPNGNTVFNFPDVENNARSGMNSNYTEQSRSH